MAAFLTGSGSSATPVFWRGTGREGNRGSLNRMSRGDVNRDLPGARKRSSFGGPGAGTNPEQLFAAGWSACCLSAIKLLAGKKKVSLLIDVAVAAS
jgi:organic hydroperoxide reductase OsmC/OhrA